MSKNKKIELARGELALIEKALAETVRGAYTILERLWGDRERKPFLKRLWALEDVHSKIKGFASKKG